MPEVEDCEHESSGRRGWQLGGWGETLLGAQKWVIQVGKLGQSAEDQL